MSQVLQSVPIEFSLETKLAIEAAILAGDKILEIYSTDFKTEYKQDREPFTLADTASEEIIVKRLSSSGYPILSEEGHREPCTKESEKCWIVDPLDGTADFIEKTGEFSVMIALMENGKPKVGVIYQPTETKLYVSERGRRAFLFNKDQWKMLRVSLIKDLLSARAVMSRHHLSSDEISILKKFGVKKVTRLGSAGLKAGAIAEGKADFYFTLTDKIKVWDTAAGECLLAEAGGRVSDTRACALVYGGENNQHPWGVLLSNGSLHQEIINKI